MFRNDLEVTGFNIYRDPIVSVYVLVKVTCAFTKALYVQLLPLRKRDGGMGILERRLAFKMALYCFEVSWYRDAWVYFVR